MASGIAVVIVSDKDSHGDRKELLSSSQSSRLFSNTNPFLAMVSCLTLTTVCDGLEGGLAGTSTYLLVEESRLVKYAERLNEAFILTPTNTASTPWHWWSLSAVLPNVFRWPCISREFESMVQSTLLLLHEPGSSSTPSSGCKELSNDCRDPSTRVQKELSMDRSRQCKVSKSLWSLKPNAELREWMSRK